MTVTLHRATDFFRPFPDPVETFAERVAEHRELLLPLAAVDLAHVDPSLQGTIHFINPVEPDDACVGEGGDAFFTYLCRENWVGYQYEDGRCVVAADLEFFGLPRLRRQVVAPVADPDDVRERQERMRSTEALNDLELHYGEMREAFDERRAHFARHGELHHEWADGEYTEEARVALANLGGHPSQGNWTSGTDFPLSRTTVVADGNERAVSVPLTEDGRRFRFVGGLDAYHYTRTHACYLLLFYDPKTATALTTFDWT